MSNIVEWYKKHSDRLRLIFVIISGVALATSLTFSWTGNAAKIAGFDPAWIAIVLCGLPIVLGAIVGLVKDHDITADVLVALALIGSLILKEFFAAGEVAFIMQIGSILEDFTSDRAKKGISKLIKLSPKKANLFVNGQIKIIEADQVKLGDILQVRAGESIPVDGKIIEGSTSIDQSAMTGESIPVEKNPSDLVMSGTINQNGSILIEAVKTAGDSSLQRMIKLAEAADADGLIIGSPNYLSEMTASFRALYERLIFQNLTYNIETPCCNAHPIPVLFIMKIPVVDFFHQII